YKAQLCANRRSKRLYSTQRLCLHSQCQRMKETKFLDEAGVVITSAHLITPSHKFPLTHIKRVTLARSPPANLLHLFKKRPYRLLVNDFKTEVTVFETSDEELVSRITAALTRARNSHTDNAALRRT